MLVLLQQKIPLNNWKNVPKQKTLYRESYIELVFETIVKRGRIFRAYSEIRACQLSSFLWLTTSNKNYNRHQDFEIIKDVCDYVYDKINNRNMLKLFFTCIWSQKSSYIIHWLRLFSCFSSVVVGDNNFYDNTSYLYLIFLTGL